jgi:hypothetical protein
MRTRIEQILERELTKLDTASQSSPEPLSVAEIKSLDTLIRAYRSFSDPAKTSPDQPASDPASAATADLLQALNDNQE